MSRSDKGGTAQLRSGQVRWQTVAYQCLTFLTDYGLEDAFVGVCHGISAQIAPSSPIIDITHLIPPGDIRRGAAVLAQAVPYFGRAVHVAVVDPGVGTARRGIAVAAADGAAFVGPDNGLLSWAVTACGGAVHAVSLTNRDLWLDAVMPTFHGRDIFIPVAAHLAAGVPLTAAGEPVDTSSLVTLPPLPSRVEGGRAEGEVVTADRFGNVQLSVTGADAARIGAVPGVRVAIRWGQEGVLIVPFGRTFGDVGPGELLAYTDSSGQVSLAVNGGSAAGRLPAASSGTKVTITVTPE